MKKTLLFLTLLFISLLTPNSCKKEEVNDYANIKSLITASPNLPPPVPAQAATLVSTQNITLTNSNGVEYGCVEKKYSYANNMSDMVALNPNAGTLYPSSLVQGKYVRDGILNSIGNFDRRPIQITMDGYGYTKTVDKPNNASITQAINEMISQNTQSTVAKINYKLVEMHNLDQAMLELGIDYDWGIGSLGGTISNTTEVGKNSILLSFIQEYYTVSVEQPSDPSNFFDANVKAEDLANRVTDTNPLCYLSSVTYGRIVLAKITSTSTSSQLRTAISGSLQALNGQITTTNNSTLTNSDFEVMILGGNAQDAITAVQGKMQGVAQFLNNGANFSPNSRGVPISYTVRHASDNSLIKLGKVLEYTTHEDCTPDPNAYKTIYIKIDGFQIVADCDNGIITNTGPGEFSYDIRIRDNSEDKKTIATTTESNINDGGYLNIDAGFYPIQILNKNGHSLKIVGYLYETDDGGTSYTNMQIPTIEFAYPFNEITSTSTTWSQVIDYGSDCSAKLYFTVRK